MTFKLESDATLDRPVLICDVCGEKLFDFWNDKATGTPTTGQLTNVTVHHVGCTPPAGAVTMPLIDFLKLFMIQNRLGDLSSDGVNEKVCVELPIGKGFSV